MSSTPNKQQQQKWYYVLSRQDLINYNAEKNPDCKVTIKPTQNEIYGLFKCYNEKKIVCNNYYDVKLVNKD